MLAKKKTVRKKTSSTNQPKSLDTKKLEVLIDNTIVLQKVVVSLTESNNHLNERISSLVGLFENASKSIDRIKEVESKEVEELAKKLGEVVTQNKDLAEGFVALEKYVKVARGDIQLNPKPLFK
jgi:predicted phage tail protein